MLCWCRAVVVAAVFFVVVVVFAVVVVAVIVVVVIAVMRSATIDTVHQEHVVTCNVSHNTFSAFWLDQG